ncbi:hypothetical protein ADEAN_000792600 [Angomonas deanei]|uniref:Uncharacterized protein n=1 Tax=Angomonas deanei TaxID=59799 RepID=A0A7G2CKK5_9TRYP|nr:hypothetical protein ADEAN_000792600 [Angomonas deanei]
MLNRSRLAKWGSTQNIPGLLSDPNSSSHTSRKMEEEKTEEGDSRHSRARTDDGTSQNTNHNNNNSVVTTFIHWNVQKWACHVQPLREAYSLYLTTSTDGDLQLHNNTIETIEAKLNELTILSKWGNQEKEGSSNNDSTPILSPVSIVVRQMNSKVNHNHITRTVFFGEVFMDITRSDVLLFYHITSEFSFIMNEQLRYCLCSAGEKEYRKIVAGLLDWKKRQRATLPPQESNKKNEKNNLKSAGAVLQVKVPTAEITFSDPRYPLLKMTASTVVLEYLQQQQQQEKGEKAGQSSPVDTITFMTSEVGVSIFGQGRWDVLLKPLGHLMFTRTTRVGRIPNETNYPHPSPSESSCLVQSTTLYGGGIQLHCSRLLLNKVQYVNREMQLLFEKPASLAWMADSETAEAVLTSLLKRRARQQQSSSRRNSRVDHFSSSKTTQVVDLRRHRPLRPDEDTASSANSGLEDEEEYDEDDEYPLSVLPGVTSSSRYTNHSSSSTRRATHRFLNIFQCGFYLVVCKADGSQTSEDNIGQVCYLPPSASIDLFIPYKQASQMMIYFYPENGGYYDEDEDQYRLNETVLQSLSNSANNKKENAAVNVAELKYGNALGLVVEDLLVVLTCKGTQDSGMAADDNQNNKTNNATASTSNAIGTTPVMWIDEKVMQSVLEKRRNAKKGEPVNNNNNNNCERGRLGDVGATEFV